MGIKRKIQLLAIVLVLPIYCYAQLFNDDLRFVNYNVSNGLSNNTCCDIHQDKLGFVWISTEDGINRFDGFKFEVFRKDANDTFPVIGNYNNIFNPSKNRKFEFRLHSCDRDYKLSYYSLIDGFVPWEFIISPEQLKLFQTDFIKPEVLSSYIFKYHFENQLLFWFDTVPEHNRLREVFSAQSSPRYLQINQYAWWGLDSNLCHFDLNNMTARVLSMPEPIMKVFNVYEKSLLVRTMGERRQLIELNIETWGTTVLLEGLIKEQADFVDSRNRLWLFREDQSRNVELLLFENGKTTKKIRLNSKLFDPEIKLLAAIEYNNQVWFGTRHHGIFVFDTLGNYSHQIMHDENDPNSLAGDVIRQFFIDRDNSLWVLTEQNGVSVLHQDKNRMRNFSAHKESPHKLSGNFVRGMSYDSLSNNLWVGTRDGGLTQLDLSTGQCKFHLQDFGEELKIESVLQVSDSMLYLGTYLEGKQPGLIRYNFKERKLHPFDKENLLLENLYTRCIIKNNSGDVLAGTMWNGLYKIDSLENISILNYSDSSIDQGGVVFIIIKSDDSGYVLGTGDGVLFLNQDLSIKEHLPHKGTNLNGLNDKTVFSLYQDGSILWAGTFLGGLNKINLRTKEIATYSTANGLCNNAVYGILPDGKGNLWLPTNMGLSCFDPVKESFRNFTTKDGLIYDSFSFGAYCKDGNGNMYLGTQEGISSFHPDSLLKVNPVNEITVRSLKVHGSNRFYNFPDSNQIVSLDYIKENLVTVDFVCPEFVDQDRIKYSYKVDKLHSKWIELDGQNKLVLSNLPYRKNTIRIRATKIPDLWNHSETSVSFYVSPPFWDTWWFRVLVMVLLVLVFILILINRTRQANRVKAIRTQLAHDLHDEIGSNISSINLIGQRMGRYGAEKDAIEKFSADIVTLSKRTSDSIRDTIWFMKPENDRPDQIKIRLKEHIYHLLEELDVDLQLDEAFFQNDVPHNTIRNVYLILKELANNIAKHAHAKQVQISVARKRNDALIKVQDDGIGLKNKKPGTGMESLKKRVKEINGELLIDSTPGNGTSISIYFGL